MKTEMIKSITLAISIVVVGITMWQVLLNRSAFRLDLYEKRLNFFRDAHKLYLFYPDPSLLINLTMNLTIFQ